MFRSRSPTRWHIQRSISPYRRPCLARACLSTSSRRPLWHRKRHGLLWAQCGSALEQLPASGSSRQDDAPLPVSAWQTTSTLSRVPFSVPHVLKRTGTRCMSLPLSSWNASRTNVSPPSSSKLALYSSRSCMPAASKEASSCLARACCRLEGIASSPLASAPKTARPVPVQPLASCRSRAVGSAATALQTGPRPGA